MGMSRVPVLQSRAATWWEAQRLTDARNHREHACRYFEYGLPSARLVPFSRIPGALRPMECRTRLSTVVYRGSDLTVEEVRAKL